MLAVKKDRESERENNSPGAKLPVGFSLSICLIDDIFPNPPFVVTKTLHLSPTWEIALMKMFLKQVTQAWKINANSVHIALSDEEYFQKTDKSLP